MRLLDKYRYYGRSALTLLSRFERPERVLGIFLGRSGALPAEVRLRREGWRFRVREPMDVWVIKETCVDGDYVQDGPLGNDWQVVDIGAGLGDFCVYAAAHCPDGLVHAYEPLATSFELLQHNLALNDRSFTRRPLRFSEGRLRGLRVRLAAGQRSRDAGPRAPHQRRDA
jgi:hypothetical protein